LRREATKFREAERWDEETKNKLSLILIVKIKI
jgi:hypothetical protein